MFNVCIVSFQYIPNLTPRKAIRATILPLLFYLFCCMHMFKCGPVICAQSKYTFMLQDTPTLFVVLSLTWGSPLGATNQPTSFSGPPFSVSPGLGSQASATMLSFVHGFWEWNSGISMPNTLLSHLHSPTFSILNE